MAQKRSRAAFEAELQAQQSPYVFFGTPLPPLDPHTRDDGSYVPVWKQEVTDERGRKRLHGAFTGGFSAGYFNSVGSKEGWAPQTFVSSRSNRAKTAQKAEDFMDEEDLADAEEAKVIETKGGFSGFGSTEDEVAGRGPLMDLFRPQGDSIGIKLLRKMGWVDGQPIGPGKRKGGGDEPGRSSTANRVISLVRKTDTRGLGLGTDPKLIVGGKKNGLAAQGTSSSTKATKPKPKRNGFGVGVLNDTGSDEEDPYDIGPKLSYSRVASEKKKNKKTENGIPTSSANPLLTSKPTFVKKTAATGFRRCHDGKLPIDGFVLSVSGPVQQDKKYSPPKVPEGWEPSRRAVPENEKSSAYQTIADVAKASTLNPTSRAGILGETLLPGQSVFDFLSPAARDKLAVASKNSELPAGKYTAPVKSPETPADASLIPRLDPQVAAIALQRCTTGFVPYADNPEKLTRYREFLEYRSTSTLTSAVSPPTCAPGVRREDFLAELQDFVNAATMFKPMSGAMANRFTTSSSGPVSQAVTSSRDDHDKDLPSLSNGGKQLTPEEEAAKLGMYGPLTRTTTTFFPTRLLCKRFGVSAPLHVQPEPENGTIATSSGGARNAARKDADVVSGFGNRFTSGGVQSSEGEESNVTRKLEILGKKDMDEMRKAAGLPALGEVVRRKERDVVVDPDRNEALEAERPSEETFKSVYEND